MYLFYPNHFNKLYTYTYIYTIMLYARMNKEYVNEDELAKSMVVSMYRKQNEAMYGETNETSIKPESNDISIKIWHRYTF